MSVLVRIRDLCAQLGGVQILRGITADLERGQMTALIGLNGAGKTTLLRAILREIPSTGSVEFTCGHDHGGVPTQHLGYVPQRLRLESNLPLTVIDLFALSLSRVPIFLGLSRAFRKRVQGMLETVGAAQLIDRGVDKLSGGELQRVLLALALEPKPELLLLDEPAAGVDFQMQQSFYRLIGQLNEKLGLTVLLVSHDLSMVSQVAQHVWCLKDGRIECQGTPQAMLRGDVLAQTFGLDAGLFVHHHGHGGE